MVFHEWLGSQGIATFEYHHDDDPERERRGEKPTPCKVTLPYDEGLLRADAETDPKYRARML